MFGNIGSSELIIIVVLGLLGLILGKDKMTDMAKSLGESTKELEKAKKEIETPEIITGESPVDDDLQKGDND